MFEHTVQLLQAFDLGLLVRGATVLVVVAGGSLLSYVVIEARREAEKWQQ